MIVFAILSVIFYVAIIILTIRGLVNDGKRNRKYHEYFARKKQEQDAWMNDHGF
jgi:hypothetical protein